MKFTCEQVAQAALGDPAKQEGAELLYHCPHPERHKNGDSHPSLRVNQKKDRWGCFVCGAGGTAWYLAAFLAGVDAGDKKAVTAWLKEHGLLCGRISKGKNGTDYHIAETYDYHDTQGRPNLQKHRLEAKGKEKTFKWERLESGKWISERGDLQPALYRSHEIKDALSVQIHEGERKVNRAFALGFFATCPPDGAGSWKPEYAPTFAGKHLHLFPDNDDTGKRCMQIIAADVFEHAMSVKIVNLPGLKEKGDIVDWLASGGTREQMEKIIAETPEWRPADGAELIRRFEGIFKDKIIASKGVSLVGALYAFMTHCYKMFSWIPYLAFFSPLESCGKSHAADIVGWASARPEILVSITEASLFRLITLAEPTVVIDEAEVLCGDGETAVALRAVLHPGNSPDDAIIRCAPNTHELERFSPWCPKVFCTISKFDRPLASRCIAIGMRRKKASEKTKAFIRRRVKGEVTELSVRIAAWVFGHQREIRDTYESLPDDFFEERGGENFAPPEAILTVADPARLPELHSIRVSLIGACEATLSEGSLGISLLKDVRRIFTEEEVDEIPSGELSEALARIRTSPWGECSKGKPITEAKLARLPKPFEVVPDRIGDRDSRVRGYRLSQFQDAFSRYLAFESVHPSTASIYTGDNENFTPSTKEDMDTSKNAVLPAENAGCGHVDTLKSRVGVEQSRLNETQPLPFQQFWDVLDV